MKSILDPAFRYTSSVSTDIRKTFAKERERLRTEAAARATAHVPVSIDARRRKTS